MLKKRFLAGCIAFVCAFGMMTALPEQNPRSVEATTLAELEAQREANNKKIQELESEMAGFQESQKEEAAYQKVLQDKIDTIQSNMQILDTELDDIKEDIFILNEDIGVLEATIAQQEIDIEKGLEQFKLRLRAMYVNGNDSLASALVGSTDFYDLLSKYELISCIARHDDELVNNLKDQLASYEVNLDTLNVQMTELEKAEDEAEVKRGELAASMEDLQTAYQESEAEQKRLEEEERMRNQNINMLEEKNALLDAAEKEILEQIRREEEARKKAEEEARKKAEEEAKKKAEEEANKNNNNNNNN
ncbi:MAG: hypothetical protein IJN57_06820, partial [Oscillospiraceae bacterium]|nr:hypothetical protein [Oscillospiraceae bacterium]